MPTHIQKETQTRTHCIEKTITNAWNCRMLLTLPLPHSLTLRSTVMSRSLSLALLSVLSHVLAILLRLQRFTHVNDFAPLSLCGFLLSFLFVVRSLCTFLSARLSLSLSVCVFCFPFHLIAFVFKSFVFVLSSSFSFHLILVVVSIDRLRALHIIAIFVFVAIFRRCARKGKKSKRDRVGESEREGEKTKPKQKTTQKTKQQKR